MPENQAPLEVIPRTADAGTALGVPTNIIAYISRPPNKNSRDAFENDLKHFFRLKTLDMLTAAMVVSVTIEDVISYTERMAADGLKHSTVCRRLATLKRMYAALKEAGLVKLNPAHPVFVPRPDRKEDEKRTFHLDPEDLSKLLAAPDDSWIGRRDFCLMMVALATGLRRRELCAIRLEEIKPEGNEWAFFVKTKRNKTRKCWLSLDEMAAIESWLRRRGRHPGPLFASREGDNAAISPSQLWKRIHYWAGPEGADIQTKTQTGSGKPQYKVTPHSFRASCIVHLAKRGWPLEKIRRYIGHESLDTTERYMSHLKVEGAEMVRDAGGAGIREAFGNPKRNAAGIAAKFAAKKPAPTR